MSDHISFLLDGKLQTIDFTQQTGLKPTTTVLQYLRGLPNHKGVKEGCAEGDCGACTIVLAEPDSNGGLAYRAVNSCLLFLPKLHGKQLITVENLTDSTGNLHPVQKTLAEGNGAQCGFCTPGIVMSLFGHYKNQTPAERDDIEDTLSGNLCRCTGYQPILESAETVLNDRQRDHFSANEENIWKILKSISNESITIKTKTQVYHLPVDLNELLQLKSNYPHALVINGSTDAALRVTKNHELLPAIIDISNIQELKDVQKFDTELQIGSGVLITDLLAESRDSFPALFKMCKTFGSKQIRNVATVGGNLGSASPIADLTPALLAYDTRVVVQSIRGERTINLDDFFRGYRQTILEADEIIKTIEIPKPKNTVRVGAYKISKRHDLDIATVSAGFRIELDDAQIVQDCKLIYGGMAAMTARAKKAELFMRGKKWNRENVQLAIPLIRKTFTPISDARSGAAFRSLAAGNLFLKFWQENTIEN